MFRFIAAVFVMLVALVPMTLAAAPPTIPRYDMTAPNKAKVGKPFTVVGWAHYHQDVPADQYVFGGGMHLASTGSVAMKPDMLAGWGRGSGNMCHQSETGAVWCYMSAERYGPLEKGRYRIFVLTITPEEPGTIHLTWEGEEQIVVVR